MLLFAVRPAGCSESIRDPLQNHTHTVAVIPARYASTRFPGKPLADIAGRPMIEHVYRRAAAAATIDAVIVATDDERIADAVRALRRHVAIDARGITATGTDRIAEVAADLDCDLIVNVQGDEPLIEPDDHRRGGRALPRRCGAADDHALPAVSTDPRTSTNPNVVKVVMDRERPRAVFLALADSLFRARRGDQPAPARSDISASTCYRREFLLKFAALAPTPLERAESLEQLRALEHGYPIKMVETQHDSIGVDTPEDLGTRPPPADGERSR